jgi:phage major head subunit gpT-like protein
MEMVKMVKASKDKNQVSPELKGIAADMIIEAVASGADGKPKNPRFSMTAYTGKPMRLWGWYNPVVIDLTGLTIPNQSRPILLNHINDPEYVMGQTDKIKVENGNVIASGEIMGVSDKAKEVIELAAKGFKWQASIGAAAQKVEFVLEDKEVKVNGEMVKGPVNVIRACRLGEISFVALGADDDTSANIAAGNFFDKEHIMAIEAKKDGQDTVQATGLPESKPEIKIEASVPATAPDMSAVNAANAANERRLGAIRKLCGTNHELCAKAIEENWTPEKTELEVLRASTPKMNGIVSQSKEFTPSVIEAVACLSAGVSEKRVLASFGEQATNNAGKYRGIGIQELFRMAARAEGRPELPAFSGTGADFIRAAFSTLSLPNILSNVANKILLEAYMSVESSWRSVAKVSSVNDFKTHSRYRLTENMKFEKVGADGELKHGKLGEQAYTVKADTSGIMFSLNRQAIINDDMGAFADIPRMIGIAAGDAVSDAVFTLLLANTGSFFSANPTGYNANYAAGAGTALSYDALLAADLLFLNQVKPNGKPLGVNPSVLLVPNSLKREGLRLMQSTVLAEGGGSSKSNVPTTNVMAGAYNVVSSSWLANSSLAGYSAKAWYLFADPARAAAMEVAFLNGVETPTVEQAEADFNTLGIQFRGFLDFGVAFQDPRAAVKMKGEA